MGSDKPKLLGGKHCILSYAGVAELADLPAGRQARMIFMFYVYILKLKTNEFYKGITNNLERRLKQHNKKTVYSTKNKLPFKLTHVEIVNTRKQARELEKFYKSGFGREIIKEIFE